MYRSGGQRVRAIAAPDAIGGLLGVEEFPAWPSTLPLPAPGLLEADRADRQDRCRQGKSDLLLDAVSAARAAQSGRARGRPKGLDGQVEVIRALVVAKRTARSEWIQTITRPGP